MAISAVLDRTLKRENVEYRTFVHPEVYTAQEVAASIHVPGHELAKAVMIKADGRLVMAVVPASERVDFEKLAGVLKAGRVELAREVEFTGFFPDSEPGAEPPFGNLYNIDTVIDRRLADDDHIYFNAGTHYEAVEMSYRDYASIVSPRVADFADHDRGDGGWRGA